MLMTMRGRSRTDSTFGESDSAPQEYCRDYDETALAPDETLTELRVPAPPAVTGSFFFNYTAPTAIYTLSLHDALPIFMPNWPGTSTWIMGLARFVEFICRETRRSDPSSRRGLRPSGIWERPLFRSATPGARITSPLKIGRAHV